MVDRDGALPHLLISGHVANSDFTRSGRGDFKVRDVEDRATHGARVSGEVDDALATQDALRGTFDLDELESLGVILAIEGVTGFSLRLESLDQMSTHRVGRRPKWMVLSVRQATANHPEVAQVWVSDEYRASFLKLFEKYLQEESETGKPKNQALVANIASVRAALLQDLWQSDGEPPTLGRHWWEIWLRPTDDAIDLAQKFALAVGARVADRHLRLDNRHVVLIEASWADLSTLPISAVPVTEIRRPQLVDTVRDLPVEEQMEYVSDLVDRITPADGQAPAACLFDTGVRRTHRLLSGSLDTTDVHSVVGGHGGDGDGHGTAMAGLALLGPLDALFEGTDRIDLIHRLESVRLMPDDDGESNDPEAYGIVTAEAAAAPEIASPRRRVFSMPITSPPDRAGEPSLWSAAVDALAVGTAVGRSGSGIDLLGTPEDAAKRLFVVSAGNIREGFENEYLDVCDLSPIEDPAQAWNALVVGSYTELTAVPSDPSFEGWSTLAEAGELSPHSRTSVIAGGNQWPIKPDICMEGGNILSDGLGDFHTSHPTLSLQTAGRSDDLAIATANATSAATAQAARLAARAMAIYPTYWPETIRGLLTHTAEWTPAMRKRITDETKKGKRELLLRRYGWGVPTEESVENSAKNAVTMVVQDSFVPFTGPKHGMREFRLHELPWPTDVLEQIGEEDVELRVTLSYFIEPSGSRRGWRRRYSYQSHALRFELRRPNETTAEFVKRVNRDASKEEDGSTSAASDDQWLVGPNQRNRGSLHQDVWSGYGAELASTGGTLAVHAVGGWWKNNNRQDRTDLEVRYALLVSLRTAAQGVDLYEPIATAIGLPTEAIAIPV